MQIATPIQIPTSAPIATLERDVVSPSRLFAVARVRFDGAMSQLRHGEADVIAPTSLAASLAITNVEAGISALRSVLVPSTSAQQRLQASTALDYATRGAELLRMYDAAVRPLGDDPFAFSDLPANTVIALERGISYLQLASTRLR